MNRLIPQKSYYEVVQFLGEGLTSQVYKAFRVDDCGYTKQLVALKIVKSKNHIQVLRKEFEKLQKVTSKHCVKVHAWENLKKGPALVLELLDGVTLEVLSKSELLTEDLIFEILAQVQQGLKDIHRHQLVHGDLNLKNIFITPEGVVKLLDFGVLHNIQDFLGTPQFMAPEVWRQLGYDEFSDLFSLGLIGEYLKGERSCVKIDATSWRVFLEEFYGKNSLLQKEPQERAFLKLKTLFLKRKKLGDLVKRVLERNTNCETLQLRSKKKYRRSKAAFATSFILMCLLLFIPKLQKKEVWGELNVRAHQWTYVSINGLPEEFTPVSKKRLRVGKYKVKWKVGQRYVEKEIQIRPKQTFILKPRLIKL